MGKLGNVEIQGNMVVKNEERASDGVDMEE